MKRIASVLTLGLALASSLLATPIVPSSYSYIQGPYNYWDDTGTQLTDGLYNGLIPGVNLGTPDSYNWVGFGGGTPSFTFNFANSVTIDNVSLSMAKWNPAGVYLPATVVINSSTFSINDSAFADMDHALLSLGGSWTGTSLTVTINTMYPGVWTFIDEVTFNEAAPRTGPSVPDSASTLGLISLSVALLVAARRQFSR